MKYVQRLNGTRTIQKTNVLEHCYNTGMLFIELAKMNNITITKSEMDYVFMHDVPEILTGDILYPAKKIINHEWEEMEYKIVQELNPSLLEYTEKEAQKIFSESSWRLFRHCDLLELALFIKDEIQLGNNCSAIMNIDHTCEELLNSHELYFHLSAHVLTTFGSRHGN